MSGKPRRWGTSQKKIVPVYLMINKPKGITCTNDLKDKTNIIDFINLKAASSS
jgi:23S rRNA pseudouridine2604 synthase